MRQFKSLHNYLQSFDQLEEVDACIYLDPFLEVVSSEKTSGWLTGQALASVNKFLLYDFIQPHSSRAGEAINRVAVVSRIGSSTVVNSITGV